MEGSFLYTYIHIFSKNNPCNTWISNYMTQGYFRLCWCHIRDKSDIMIKGSQEKSLLMRVVSYPSFSKHILSEVVVMNQLHTLETFDIFFSTNNIILTQIRPIMILKSLLDILSIHNSLPMKVDILRMFLWSVDAKVSSAIHRCALFYEALY